MYKKYVYVNGLEHTIQYGLVDIDTDKEIKDWSGDKLASFSFIEQSLKSLTGRILTIIDASLPEGKQNKCVKDLIRKEFIHEFESIADMLMDKQRLQRAMNDIDQDDFELVDAEDILGA